ncbi:SMC-Scp complex subunit ScpB [Micromonospora sp. NPDC007230]|uniref:SMC-Scp complex subunit ScpB n=1 Tax=Micromonospora sp. NPDC007230 TaxID=3364237 RepID=UPI0036AA5D9D
MSDEESRDSLADQAAAWVPPWERPAPARSAPAEADPEFAAAAEPAATAAPAVAEPATPEPEPAAEPTPATAEPTLATAEPEPAAEPTLATAEPEPAAEPTLATAEPEPAADLRGDGSPEYPPPANFSTPPDPAADLGAEVPLEGPGGTKISEAPTEAAGAGALAGESGSAGEPLKQAVGRRRVTVAPEPAPELSDAELRGALEAILLVVDQPVSELTLAQVLEQSPERIGPMLDDIAAGYTAAGHGFELRRAAGGWRLYTRPEYATYVERFVLDGQSVRLTQAALETLAVVAYKQPVTRSRISAIRGVNCDGVIRTLVSRGLVEECGTEPDSGAFLYRTTTMFLEKLGLNSVDDLPPLAPFLPDDVEELADATR